MCDTQGRDLQGPHRGHEPVEVARTRSKPSARTLAEALKGADVFVGLSARRTSSPRRWSSRWRKEPIIFALANPDPEIGRPTRCAARPDAIIATGRCDYPNQVNNVLGFPFIFRGALDVRATAINEEMKLAAAEALAELAREDVPEAVAAAYGGRSQFGRDYIIPEPFDPRLMESSPGGGGGGDGRPAWRRSRSGGRSGSPSSSLCRRGGAKPVAQQRKVSRRAPRRGEPAPGQIRHGFQRRADAFAPDRVFIQPLDQRQPRFDLRLGGERRGDVFAQRAPTGRRLAAVDLAEQAAGDAARDRPRQLEAVAGRGVDRHVARPLDPARRIEQDARALLGRVEIGQQAAGRGQFRPRRRAQPIERRQPEARFSMRARRSGYRTRLCPRSCTPGTGHRRSFGGDSRASSAASSPGPQAISSKRPVEMSAAATAQSSPARPTAASQLAEADSSKVSSVSVPASPAGRSRGRPAPSSRAPCALPPGFRSARRWRPDGRP